MLFLVLSLVFVFSLPTDANLCIEDVDLDNVQEHSYDLPYPPLDDYWNKGRIEYNQPKNRQPLRHNLNLAFHVFGKYSGNTADAVIKAGYYGEGNELIYSVEVNCADKTWRSFAPSTAKVEALRFSKFSGSQGELYQEGVLEKECVDGEEFDLIFKVKQAHQFTWMFNAENLQKGYQQTEVRKISGGKLEVTKRNRTLNVPSPDESPAGGAAKAVRFNVESSGAAVITRFAFGRCMTWPRNMACNKAQDWLTERSKSPTERGPLGLHLAIFNVNCLKQAPSLYQATQLLHPDEFSKPKSTWVCCVNMKTGQLWDGDKDNNCRDSQTWYTELSPFFCQDAFDVDLVTEETAKYQEQNEVEAQAA